MPLVAIRTGGSDREVGILRLALAVARDCALNDKEAKENSGGTFVPPKARIRDEQLFLHNDTQVFQLSVAHRRRRVDHQVYGAGGFGEGNYLAQALGSGDDHHDAIEA
jgi:hypothetical protein